MNKKVVISQSSYIPWKGYFDMINLADEFILLDNVQYTKRDWRSRNMIKLPQGGSQWLTIPIKVKGNYHQLICEAEAVDSSWAEHHLELIRQRYKAAPYFKEYAKWLAELYEEAGKESLLSKINFLFIKNICNFLGIQTKLSHAADYTIPISSKTERLLYLCLAAGATTYLSGPRAKDYFEQELFDEKNIAVEWLNYDDYLAYPQQGSDFVHTVSILDMIFNLGRDTSKYMKSF